jgi:hypothetical protein
MSYRCGIGGRLAKHMEPGIDPRPHIICDGCGAKVVIEFPPKWFLNGRPPPGWKTVRHEDGTRTDYCKKCKEK